MPLINKKPNLIHIPLYYQEKTTKSGYTHIVILDDKEAQKMLEDEKQKDNVQVLNTKWKTMNWKDQNKIIKLSRTQTLDGMQDVDIYEFRDQRIKTCLVSWDLKEDNNDIPVTPENIDLLDPDVVLALIVKYDNEINLTDEDSKN